jgi:alcohol dehydrogenase class IV
VTRFGLQRAAALPDVVSAVAPATGRSPADLAHLLGGAAPADDAGLLRLANALDALEAAAGVPSGPKGSSS